MSYEQLITILKGSTTSGNWGHSGRPGKRGGSGPGGGHGAVGITGNIPPDKRRELITKLRESRASAGKVPANKTLKRLTDLTGGTLHISDENSPVVKNIIDDLNLLPDKLLSQMASKKVQLYIGDKSATDLNSMQHLKGQQPRGWPPGSTWDTVAGLYNHAGKKVLAGSGRSGSVSVILHEYGHAIQNNILTKKQFRRLYDVHGKIYDKLPGYLRQGGPKGGAGVSELWAEGFATAVKDRPRAIKEYGQEFVSIVDEVLK